MNESSSMMDENFNMVGGDLIAEGGFGCIFKPAINCKGREMENDKYVSKIQKYDKNSKSEIKIGSILKKIFGHENYFGPILNHCALNVSKIKTKEKKKCSIFRDTDTNKFIIMKMNYIPGDKFLDYLMINSNSNEIINTIMSSYNHILNGITMLVGNGLVHFDIKGNNILFNSLMKTPVIIDFGLSINMNMVKYEKQYMKQIFYIYAPEYYIWPLEVHYLSYILNEKEEMSLYEMHNLVNKYIANNSILKMFSEDFINNYKKLCEFQLIKYNKLKMSDKLQKLCKYWNTWDNYALSILYLKFLKYICGGKYLNNKFIILFSQILIQNINPNPEKRLSLEKTTKEFNAFLYDNNIDNVIIFNNLVEQFMKNKKHVYKQISIDIKNQIYLTKQIKK